MKKKLVKKKAVYKKKSLTTAEKQGVRNLAEMLGNLIPLSGYRSSFSLTNVAKENKLSKYLPQKTSNKTRSNPF